MISDFIVILSENAANQIKGLPKKIQQAITNKLEKSQKQPFHFFMRLKSMSDYKMRCNDYRVIADIDINERKIFVTKIGHRKNVYEQ